MRHARSIAISLFVAAAVRPACADAPPAPPAAAAPPSVRLEYVRAAAATGCPDEAELRDTVSARLGYDPFRDDAATVLRAEIRREPSGLRARVELRDAGGALLGARDLASRARDCRELSSAVALAIAIAIDPMQVSRPVAAAQAPACPPCPPAAACPPPPPPLACPPPPPPAQSQGSPPPNRAPVLVQYRAAAGAHVAVLAGPAAAPGLDAELALRFRWVSIGLSGRFDFASPAPLDAGGALSVEIAAGGLNACVHYLPLAVCAIGLGGVLFATFTGADGGPTRRTSAPWVAAGARIAVELPIYRQLHVRVRADGLGTLARARLCVGGECTAGGTEVWAAPAGSIAVGLDLAGFF